MSETTRQYQGPKHLNTARVFGFFNLPLSGVPKREFATTRPEGLCYLLALAAITLGELEDTTCFPPSSGLCQDCSVIQEKKEILEALANFRKDKVSDTSLSNENV